MVEYRRYVLLDGKLDAGERIVWSGDGLEGGDLGNYLNDKVSYYRGL